VLSSSHLAECSSHVTAFSIHPAEPSSHVTESSSQVAESCSHLAEYSSHVAKSSSHFAESSRIKQVFYERVFDFLVFFECFFLRFCAVFSLWCHLRETSSHFFGILQSSSGI
jgi:Fe2+ transport system protein B